jgi:hypothetical protein
MKEDRDTSTLNYQNAFICTYTYLEVVSFGINLEYMNAGITLLLFALAAATASKMLQRRPVLHQLGGRLAWNLLYVPHLACQRVGGSSSSSEYYIK